MAKTTEQEGDKPVANGVAGTLTAGCAVGASQVPVSGVCSSEEKNLSHETRRAP